jgi:putative MFS transporter
MLLGTASGIWFIDALTRRQFLISTFYLSAALLLILVAVRTGPILTVAASALFAFVLAGSTVLDFAYLPELFPTRLRASGVGVGTAASRVGSACGTFMLPVCIESLGIRPTLALCVGILAAGGIFCHAFAPETQGRSIDSH